MRKKGKFFFFPPDRKSKKKKKKKKLTPTWLSLSTSAPQNSSRLARQSPMIVERRWPTCISLATLGDEKSTTARSTPAGRAGAHVEGPATSMATSLSPRASRESLMLMKPGPASEGGLAGSRSCAAGDESELGSAATILAATSRGALGAPSLPLSLPKTPIALLHW